MMRVREWAWMLCGNERDGGGGGKREKRGDRENGEGEERREGHVSWIQEDFGREETSMVECLSSV